MFNYTEDELKEKKATFTTREILQQPTSWNETFHLMQDDQDKIKQFLMTIQKNNPLTRVIFAGAGTSAYVGYALIPILRKSSPYHKFFFEAIATTDIVSDPGACLEKEFPTIIVSFARSGNSPESVAAVKIASDVVTHCYFLTITCNAEGTLAKQTVEDDHHLLVVLPSETNDKGFAMTSSFTSMFYAASLAFLPESLKNSNGNEALVKVAESFIKQSEESITEIENTPFKRVIYLGTSSFSGLAWEAALKCLELNAGRLDTYHESSMGFRHGPKSLQTDGTLIILFCSPKLYSKKYDLDIAQEIASESISSRLIVLCRNNESSLFENSDQIVPFTECPNFEDSEVHRCLLYILFAQLFALNHSLKLGITPDNPSPDGKVNRVVQGVKIHQF